MRKFKNAGLRSVECMGEQHPACRSYTLDRYQRLRRCGCACHAAVFRRERQRRLEIAEWIRQLEQARPA